MSDRPASANYGGGDHEMFDDLRQGLHLALACHQVRQDRKKQHAPGNGNLGSMRERDESDQGDKAEAKHQPGDKVRHGPCEGVPSHRALQIPERRGCSARRSDYQRVPQ